MKPFSAKLYALCSAWQPWSWPGRHRPRLRPRWVASPSLHAKFNPTQCQ